MAVDSYKKVACSLFFGANGEASIIDRINLINALRLFTGNWSPHGSYDPTKYDELKNVIGYKK